MSADIVIRNAVAGDVAHAERICELINLSSRQRGTGIARREPEYITQKMTSGRGVIALDGERVVGFSYIECWGHGDFVATSGLIVDPEYRRQGLAARIKDKTFELARTRFPYAKIFSMTTSLAVMKLNSRLGFQPVTLNELTDDEEFWQGCEGCVNYEILQRNDRRVCLCYGMLYDPEQHRRQAWYVPYVMAFKNMMSRIFRLKQ